MYGNRGFGGQPVKVGDELDVQIEAVGEKGDGIAKEKGFVLFVPGVKKGDSVRIRVTKVLKKVGFAEVVGKGQESATTTEEAPQEESSEEEEYSEEPSNAPEDTENFGEDMDEEK